MDKDCFALTMSLHYTVQIALVAPNLAAWLKRQFGSETSPFPALIQELELWKSVQKEATVSILNRPDTRSMNGS